MQRQPGDHAFVIWRQVAADFEAFLEIAFRLLGRVQILAADAEPAAMAGRVFYGDFFLLGIRQGKEALGLLIHRVDLRRRDAVVDRVEKPDLAAGMADGFDH